MDEDDVEDAEGGAVAKKKYVLQRQSLQDYLLISKISAEWAMLRRDEVDINGGWKTGTP